MAIKTSSKRQLFTLMGALLAVGALIGVVVVLQKGDIFETRSKAGTLNQAVLRNWDFNSPVSTTTFTQNCPNPQLESSSWIAAFVSSQRTICSYHDGFFEVDNNSIVGPNGPGVAPNLNLRTKTNIYLKKSTNRYHVLVKARLAKGAHPEDFSTSANLKVGISRKNPKFISPTKTPSEPEFLSLAQSSKVTLTQIAPADFIELDIPLSVIRNSTGVVFALSVLPVGSKYLDIQIDNISLVDNLATSSTQ